MRLGEKEKEKSLMSQPPGGCIIRPASLDLSPRRTLGLHVGVVRLWDRLPPPPQEHHPFFLLSPATSESLYSPATSLFWG